MEVRDLVRSWLGHPLYDTWKGMKKRCYDEDAINYADYGARGIYVCERWLDNGEHDGFANFVADMGERPEGHTLDRISNDGIYEPSNCRWLSAEGQARNRRNAKLSVPVVAEIKRRLNMGGARGFKAAMAREFGITSQEVNHIRRGTHWASVEAAA